MGNGRETHPKRMPQERPAAIPVMSVHPTMVSAHLCRPSLGGVARGASTFVRAWFRLAKSSCQNIHGGFKIHANQVLVDRPF